jgi:GNAT superfamily N-acetyltransferase
VAGAQGDLSRVVRRRTSAAVRRERGGDPVGYALVVWHEGADDTFPLAPRYAELYTLSVAERARGAGVGGRLLDAVDEALADEGDPPLAIAVMAANTDALRFYARRGLVPGELLLYRFRAARVDPASADTPPP